MYGEAKANKGPYAKAFWRGWGWLLAPIRYRERYWHP